MKSKYVKFAFSYANALAIGLAVGFENESVLGGVTIGAISMFCIYLFCCLVFDEE